LAGSGAFGLWFDTNLIVHCMDETLAAPQVTFGRLDGPMAQQELDLL